MKKRALLSVYDKTGIVDFAKSLVALDYQIVSTGGTLAILRDNGVEVVNVSDITGFPECLDGRVKTLHPVIHAGILAMRDNAAHVATLKEHDIAPIEIVAINLYPFRETVSRPDHTLAEAIENIDIGGPTMLRAAAKNHKDVITLVDPADYDAVVSALQQGEVTLNTRQLLALKVFGHTAHYDAMISGYLRKSFDGAAQFPQKLTLPFDFKQALRYGENPQQAAAFYSDALPLKTGLANAEQLHGKALSFNNLNDAEAAIAAVCAFDKPTCVAVKHANPCGIGEADDIDTAYQKAYAADDLSIFGGILAFNRPVTAVTAAHINKIFIEVVIAPDYAPEALEILQKKANIRLLKMPIAAQTGGYDMKRLSDGVLLQTENEGLYDELKVVGKVQPDAQMMDDLVFALKAVKQLKSNAIAIAKDGQTLGMGPGQVSRIWAAEKAVGQAGDKARGAVLASDAYIPFNDVIELAAKAGITAIVQPGGSKNDERAIEACDEYGIAMLFCGMRHFKH